MTQSIITYYIPQNLNITKGKIYNLYLNKVTNLDLSEILPSKNNNLNNNAQPITQKSSQNNKFSISQEDYNNILALADTSTKLYTQSQALVKKLTKGDNK